METPQNLRQGAREEAADKGTAMPGGRFPIRNAEEVGKAIRAFSLAKGDKGAVKAFIIRRAKALGCYAQWKDQIDNLSTD